MADEVYMSIPDVRNWPKPSAILAMYWMPSTKSSKAY